MDVVKERAEEIFCAALELSDSAERLVFLEQTCAGDASLRATVEQMLAEQGNVKKLFDEYSPARVPVTWLSQAPGEGPGFPTSVGIILSAKEEAGQQIGPYKLLERIGEGGCGVVYTAEQLNPVRRRVALKRIKLGMDIGSVIARFEQERQALALMDHPNIARVLDAGGLDRGGDDRPASGRAGGGCDRAAGPLPPTGARGDCPFYGHGRSRGGGRGVEVQFDKFS
jgi:hypothetical protein